eukprot:10606556-Alexandrium_andersonii.AAC.1
MPGMASGVRMRGRVRARVHADTHGHSQVRQCASAPDRQTDKQDNDIRTPCPQKFGCFVIPEFGSRKCRVFGFSGVWSVEHLENIMTFDCFSNPASRK